MALQKKTIIALAAAFLLVTAAIVTTIVVLVNKNSDSSPEVSKLEQLTECLREGGLPESRIVARNDSAVAPVYADLNWQWNSLHGNLTPMAYVVAESDADVSAGVRCGVEAGVRVVAKSGGHSYVKFGFGDADSLIVDLHRMNSISVNGTVMVATIGAGSRGGKVQHDLWAAGGFIVPVGNCPTVGVAGYSLGGGYGFFTRWLGLLGDHIVEATVVDAGGAIRVVNKETDPELFWAMRGAGGGNFGIVTSLKLRIHKAPPSIVVAMVEFEFEIQFVEFFRSWQRFIRSNQPAHLNTMWSMSSAARGTISLFLVSMGGNVTEIEGVLAEWFPPTTGRDIQEYTHETYMVQGPNRFYFDEPLLDPSQLARVTRHNGVGWKKVRSFLSDRVLETDQELRALQDLFRDYVQWNDFFFEQYGGSIKDTTEDTSFSHRDMLYDVQIAVFEPRGDGSDTAEAVGAMNTFWDGSKALLGHTRSYQNYLDEDLDDYLQRYYGPNLERLVAVKKRVDPDNVFHNPLTIPVSL